MRKYQAVQRACGIGFLALGLFGCSDSVNTSEAVPAATPPPAATEFTGSSDAHSDAQPEARQTVSLENVGK
jgi:hypothetical protein